MSLLSESGMGRTWVSKKYLFLVIPNVETKGLSVFGVVGEGDCFSHLRGSGLKYVLHNILFTMHKDS